MMDSIIDMIKRERALQDAKWGDDQRQPMFRWFVILMEEVGEASKAYLDHHWRGDPKIAVTEELVQCAAVVVKMLEQWTTIGDCEESHFDKRGLHND